MALTMMDVVVPVYNGGDDLPVVLATIGAPYFRAVDYFGAGRGASVEVRP